MADMGFRVSGFGFREEWSLGPALYRFIVRVMVVLGFWFVTAVGLFIGAMLDHSPLSSGGHWWQGVVLVWFVVGLVLASVHGMDPWSRNPKPETRNPPA
jgi:hypothetical protein